MEKSLFRSFTFIIALAVFPILIFSQQLFYENGNPSHPNVLGYESTTRSIIDLAGEWEYSLDEGMTWQKVMIPAAADFEGKIVYRRKFSVGADTVGRNGFTFVSYGINYQAEIYINETFVGKHEGGYTSFEFPVSDGVIQVGRENVIRVVVDNSRNYQTSFPTAQQVDGWKNYNGLVRDIFIVATPKVWINHAEISVESIEPKAVKFLLQPSVSASDFSTIDTLAGKQFQFSIEMIESSSGAVIGKPLIVSVTPETNKEIVSHISIAVPNAKLWSPESPELYTAKIQLQAVDGKNISLVDETSVTTGVRTVVKEKSNILFNGTPITLRGVVWIEDSEKNGSAITYEKMERDVALIKNLGANAVRIAYHPPHPFFIQMCDRYGLIVLEEIPNFEIPTKILETENYRALVDAYLKTTIERDKHNPSVIAWGFGEAFGASGNNNDNIVLQLQRTAKSLDDRLTYYVSHGNDPEFSKVVDISAVSIIGGGTERFRSGVLKWKGDHKTQPVIVAGYGLRAEMDNRNGYSDPMSQEAQARGLLQRYNVIKDLDLPGGFITSFNDYRSDRPIMSVKPIDPWIHTNGIVELNREKKVAYDVVRAMYLGQKISALPIGSFTQTPPYAYVVIGLSLLISAAWLINGNRRYRESTRRAILNSYNFFADIRDQFTLPLFHTTLTAIIIAATFSVVFSSIIYYFRTSMILDYTLSYLFPNGVKKIIIAMAWEPLRCIGYLAGVMLLWFFVLTFLIQFFSVVAKVKIRLFHSYSIAVWTALPWAIFIPVGMILFRILQSDFYIPWITGLIVFMCLWVFMRTLKGISVIYNMYTPKMYLIGIMFVLVIAGSLYVYLDYTLSFSAYAEYFVSSYLPSVF